MKQWMMKRFLWAKAIHAHICCPDVAVHRPAHRPGLCAMWPPLALWRCLRTWSGSGMCGWFLPPCQNATDRANQVARARKGTILWWKFTQWKVVRACSASSDQLLAVMLSQTFSMRTGHQRSWLMRALWSWHYRSVLPYWYNSQVPAHTPYANWCIAH